MSQSYVCSLSVLYIRRGKASIKHKKCISFQKGEGMEILFYCQACDQTIKAEELAFLNEGKCPHCDSLEGFSSARKEENEIFETLTVLNDTEFLKKI